tara:strand:- start:98 stop:319 length:222 start_codon:yes stop_codon:yes gene_type:complete
MNTDREDLRLLITEFNDGPMGSADDFAWRRHLKTYEDLLAEVKRLRSVIKDFESFLYFEGFNPKEVYDEGEEE